MTLTLVTPENEWEDIAKMLAELQGHENIVVSVIQEDARKVIAIFVLLDVQQKLYQKYGKVIELD